MQSFAHMGNTLSAEPYLGPSGPPFRRSCPDRVVAPFEMRIVVIGTGVVLSAAIGCGSKIFPARPIRIPAWAEFQLSSRTLP
jgi:hypothetical protein